jgi:predicted XRE-type DNA-binding protein
MKPHPSRTRQTVVSNVSAEMGRRRVTQKRMAQWLGISQAAASDRLNGKTAFTLDELDVLCERLEVPISVLIQEVPYAATAADFQARRGLSDQPGRTAGTVKNWKLMNLPTGEPITARPARRASRVHHSTCFILTGTQGESWTRHAPTSTSSRCDAARRPRSTHAGGFTAASKPTLAQR